MLYPGIHYTIQKWRHVKMAHTYARKSLNRKSFLFRARPLAPRRRACTSCICSDRQHGKRLSVTWKGRPGGDCSGGRKWRRRRRRHSLSRACAPEGLLCRKLWRLRSGAGARLGHHVVKCGHRRLKVPRGRPGTRRLCCSPVSADCLRREEAKHVPCLTLRRLGSSRVSVRHRDCLRRV